MHSIKSLSLLNTLEAGERQLFLYLLQGQDELHRLATRLTDETYTDSRALYAAAFPGKPYNDKLLRNALYALNKQLERVIALRYVANDPVISNYVLMNHCFRYNLSKEYNGYLLRARQEESISGSHELLYAYLAQKTHLEYLEEKKRQFIQEELIRKDQLLDAYYFKEKLWNLFEIDVYKNIYHFEYQPLLSDYAQRVQEHEFSFAQSAIRFQQMLLQMFEDFENDDHFYRALGLLEANYQAMPKKDLRYYYIAIINYAIKKFNLGRKIFTKELFHIYTLQIKHGVVLNEKQQIEPYAYKNITTLALQNQEFAWTRKFLEDYKPFLPKEERDNAYQYNLANYYYFTGHFKQCLQLLQTVQFTDVYYNLDARSIILKIYFEEKEWNLLHDHAFAFKAFVLRQQDISDYHKKGYLNLIKWANKLSTSVFDTRKRAQLSEKIAGEKNIRELKWLMAQLEKLG